MSNGGFDINTYNAVFHELTLQEIERINIALDIQAEAERKAMKRKH